MPQFAYYIPNKRNLTATDLEAIGIRQLFDGEISHNPLVGAGPDGGNGEIVSSDAQSSLYDPGSQRWENCGAYWLGWNKDSPPGPEDLIRKGAIVGRMLKLGDGREWQCPEWRSIPVTFSQFDPGSPMQSSVSPQYRYLEPIVSQVVGTMMGDEKASDAELLMAALAALAVNYRVRMQEVSALGLLSSDTVTAILLTLVGGYEKKADSAGSSSSAGNAA